MYDSLKQALWLIKRTEIYLTGEEYVEAAIQ